MFHPKIWHQTQQMQQYIEMIFLVNTTLACKHTVLKLLSQDNYTM